MEPVSNILYLNNSNRLPETFTFINVEGIRCVSPVLKDTEGSYRITVFYEKGSPVNLVLMDLSHATAIAAAIFKHWVSYTEYINHLTYERMLKQMDIF